MSKYFLTLTAGFSAKAPTIGTININLSEEGTLQPGAGHVSEPLLIDHVPTLVPAIVELGTEEGYVPRTDLPGDAPKELRDSLNVAKGGPLQSFWKKLQSAPIAHDTNSTIYPFSVWLIQSVRYAETTKAIEAFRRTRWNRDLLAATLALGAIRVSIFPSYADVVFGPGDADRVSRWLRHGVAAADIEASWPRQWLRPERSS